MNLGWSPDLLGTANAPTSLADARQAAFGLMLWLGGVVLTLLAGVVILVYVRRRMKRTPTLGYEAFTLDDIRGMRARGEISDDEYDTLRRRLVGLDPARRAKPMSE